MKKKLDESALLAIFKDEAHERLQKMNKRLLELEKSPNDESALNDLLREIHNLKGTARMAGFSGIAEIAHKIEDVLSTVQKGKTPINEVSESIFVSLDSIGPLVDAVVSGSKTEIDVPSILQHLDQLSKRVTTVASDKQKQTGSETKPLGEILVEDEVISREQLENALKRQKESMLRELEETIRVSTKKLDNLANTVGEMIIDQTKFEVYLQSLNEVVIMAKEQRKRFIEMSDRIKTALDEPQNAHTEEMPALMDKHADSSTKLVERLLQVFSQQQDSASTLANTTDKLQSDIMTLRMLPVPTVFDMFPRTVHDLAKEYEKKIDLEIYGSETEVDKKVLELIKDPLMHLLRNAADHGIEPPAERKSKGKTKSGKITLSAWQEGDRIFIMVEDDGRGIDPATIKEIAVKKGMLDPDDAERMTDEEARHFIFKSGFSTSRIITDVSGRGVGEDVVRKNVEDNLGGQVLLKSAVNKGTSFTLVLPLTLAVTPSVFVKVAGQLFALPAASVLFGLRINPDEIQSVEGKEAITVINAIVPLARMDEVLEKSAAAEDSENHKSKSSRIRDKLHVVVVEYAHQKIAFLVDELVKEQNIIVKPMEKPLQKVKNIAGVTILEKGEVVPILHVPELMESAKQVSADRKITASPVEKISKKSQRILIVEDSLTTRELEKSILTSVGYDVDTAVNGVDALNKIFERAPDLIITDVQMPEMDGFQLTKKLRMDARYQEIPVVMVTALAKDEEKRRGIEAGADAYITKTDFDQANLVVTIERLIG